MNKEALNEILELLRRNHFNQQADELEVLASQYYSVSKDEKENIAVKIKQICHPKWLGDFFIHGITQKDWFGLLDRLNRSIKWGQ
jgi:hypothetical protein